MNITLEASHLIQNTTKGRMFDLTVEAETAIENEPPIIKLTINRVVAFEAPLVIVNEIIAMLETAKFAIKQHSLKGHVVEGL